MEPQRKSFLRSSFSLLTGMPMHRRYALLLGLFVLFGLLALGSQPHPSLSSEPSAVAPQSELSAPIIYTVDRCPPNYQKALFLPSEVVYLTGGGFRPWEPIYWEIWGMPGSCDQNRRIAHSRMTAGWNGSFCIYCYTVAGDDCGLYRIVVNGVYATYYEVPAYGGPTATATASPTVTRTATPTFVPTPYTFAGYVYEEAAEAGGVQPAVSAIPLIDVRVELYFSNGREWQLVDETRTTNGGWFALSYITDRIALRFRVVEVDPPGYESVRAVKPPLYGVIIDPNTIELRLPYARNPGVMYFYDRRAAPTEVPTATPTITGTPPTLTMTPTPIPTEFIITRVLQQGRDGYTGVEDTYISSWFLYTNYSRYNMMSIRSGHQMAPLLRFDLRFIPSNSLVLSATMSAYVASAGPHRMRADAYRIYRPWVVEEVNWIEASRGYKWAEWGCSRPGSDHAEMPSDGEDLIQVGRWYDFDVTTMAQDWVSSPASNQGVLLKGGGDVSVQWNFYASEYWQMQFRPKLTITYAITGPTPTPTFTRRPTATPTDTPTRTRTPPPIPFGQ